MEYVVFGKKQAELLSPDQRDMMRNGQDREMLGADERMEYVVFGKKQAELLSPDQRDMMRNGQDRGMLYHESQKKQLCLRHSLNALLEGPKFTTQHLDDIADDLWDGPIAREALGRR